MTDDELKQAGITIVHHFCDHLYAKETRIPAGKSLTQHRHASDHLSLLGIGQVVVVADGVPTQYSAPACITIKGGVAHSVTAITEVVWYCIHATDEKDPTIVDTALIASSAALTRAPL